MLQITRVRVGEWTGCLGNDINILCNQRLYVSVSLKCEAEGGVGGESGLNSFKITTV